MVDLFENLNTDDLMDVFVWGSDENTDFEVVKSELYDYDEGMVYTQNVVKHKPSNRLFGYISGSNSWADYDEDFDVEDIFEVKAVEKLITVYEPITV